jgi:hypothetical protein
MRPVPRPGRLRAGTHLSYAFCFLSLCQLFIHIHTVVGLMRLHSHLTKPARSTTKQPSLRSFLRSLWFCANGEGGPIMGGGWRALKWASGPVGKGTNHPLHFVFGSWSTSLKVVACSSLHSEGLSGSPTTQQQTPHLHTPLLSNKLHSEGLSGSQQLNDNTCANTSQQLNNNNIIRPIVIT